MPIANSTSYNLSFTAASLRPELARIVAEYYLTTGDWETAKSRILCSNALQARSATSAARMERELRHRLETLTPDQISMLVHGPAEDRAAFAWLAVCKHVAFAFEFTAEVLREKLAIHDPILRYSDYETYVENKSLSHAELGQLTSSSKSKIRRVLLLMLTEAGLLSAGTALGMIQRPVLSPAVIRTVSSESPRWLAAFLVPDTEIGDA